MRAADRMLVRLDQPPWSALFGVTVGYAVVPVWLWATSSHVPGWTLVPFLLVVLASIRIVPAVLRKLLPFDRDAQQIWAERRRMAKRYDSFQWRKLFWIGAGLFLYAWASGSRFGVLMGLAQWTLIAGAAGQIIWQYRARELRRMTETSTARGQQQ